MRPLIIVSLVGIVSCARPAVSAWPPAPNPNGCYVMVFDRPDYIGIRDVWNGPAKWSTLEGLQHTRRDGWQDEIRSLRVGPGAMVTVFTDADFRGDSRQFSANTDQPQLDATWAGRIESLVLTCQPAAPATPAR